MNDRLKVTFSIAPRTDLSYVNFAAQIVSTNLLRNNRLDVVFDYILPIENELYQDKRENIFRYYKLDIDESHFKIPFLYLKELLPGFYREYIKTTIDSEYVIVSLANLSGGSEYIKALLEAGKKVVVGGAAINVVTSDLFRKVLVEDMQVDPRLVYDNMIIIHGYVDLYFDFYETIRSWQDVDIPIKDVNFFSFYETDFNPLAPFYNEDTYLTIFLFIGCQWRKCKHCWMSIPNYVYKKNINICKQLNVSLIRKYFDICKQLYPKVNQLYVADNYIAESEINFLKEVDVSQFDLLHILTGVKELLKENYTDKLFQLNKNMHFLLGFDFLNEFSLKFMNKGYTIKDIFSCIDMMENKQQKYSTDLIVKGTIINDAPMDYKWREKEEDENLEKIINQISQFGIYNDLRYNQLIYPGSYLDVHTSKYYKKTISHLEADTSGGIAQLIDFLNGYRNLAALKYYTKPFIRYDEDGNIITARHKNG